MIKYAEAFVPLPYSFLSASQCMLTDWITFLFFTKRSIGYRKRFHFYLFSLACLVLIPYCEYKMICHEAVYTEHLWSAISAGLWAYSLTVDDYQG